MLTSSNIPIEVMSGFIYSTDQSAKILLFKTEYTPRDGARFVIIFNFQYDLTANDELKVTSHEQKWLDASLSPTEKSKTKDTTNILF